ncbi:MAG: DUF885 domain-containing protein [Bacteroidia bacterium]|nr:DUF885 domain-containing protein [Bacteroidia bacterium]
MKTTLRINLNSFLIFLLSAFLVFPLAGEAQERSEALHKIFQAEQDFRKERNKKWKEDWPYYTEEFIVEELLNLTIWEQDLAKINVKSLNQSDQINWELFRHTLEDRIFNLKYQSYLMPLNSEGGFITGILYNIQSLRLRNTEAQESYLRKLAALPAYLARQQALLEEGLEKKITVPKIIVEKCLNIIEGFAETPADQSVFVKPFDGFEAEDNGYLRAVELLEAEIIPAYKKFYEYVKGTYLRKTRESIAARELPEGAAYYEQRVRFFTTLDISPEEVFETGQSEVARIRGEMEEIIEELDFEGSFADFLEFLRTDPQFYPKSPEELLHKAAWISKRAEAFLPRYFGNLPRMPFTVEPVPAAIAPNYTGGRYSEGNYKTGKPGAFWVNTYALHTRPLYVLPALALHEGVPGHHTQIMLSSEIKDVPAFRRNTYLSAFGEGWALYAEYLGKEAGIYQTPYEHFGRLTYEMWRACRLVVDVGMHYKGWTRQEALDFMAENTALSLHEVETEIDRYIGWPAQAVSYKMGEISIRKLRKEAEEALGEKFDIREFHDEVLKNGSIPMLSLQRIIRKYIEQKQK